MEQKRYGLITAVTMISGIVIGSGIFFKSDNVLVYTQGNVLLGVAVWVMAALSIIFGSLSIAQLAAQEGMSETAGGVITYTEHSWNKGVACAFGWFHSFLYYPTLVAVVGWVAGVYTCILFGLEESLENQVLLGYGYIAALFVLNALSARLGGLFQNASMAVKLIPLLLIAAAGIALGDPAPVFAQDIQTLPQTAGWTAAIVPIAFSFDGWIVATSVGHEIKNSPKNLPAALVITPLLILTVYVLYFVGICLLVGPENILALGDAHVNLAARGVFGPLGGKLIVVFVIVSVLGTVNGLTLGLIRMPYSLALRNMLPGSALLRRMGRHTGMPAPSALLSFFVVTLWVAIHYFTQKLNLLPNSDVSEISIVFNYTFYILMYLGVMKLARRGLVKGFARGWLYPVLAVAGSLFILAGGMSSPLFPLYTALCAGLVGISAWYYLSHRGDIA